MLSLSQGTHQKEEEGALSHCYGVREREGVCTLSSCYRSISIIRKRGRETETSLRGKHVVIVLLQHQHCQEEGEREREKGAGGCHCRVSSSKRGGCIVPLSQHQGEGGRVHVIRERESKRVRLRVRVRACCCCIVVVLVLALASGSESKSKGLLLLAMAWAADKSVTWKMRGKKVHQSVSDRGLQVTCRRSCRGCLNLTQGNLDYPWDATNSQSLHLELYGAHVSGPGLRDLCLM